MLVGSTWIHRYNGHQLRFLDSFWQKSLHFFTKDLHVFVLIFTPVIWFNTNTLALNISQYQHQSNIRMLQMINTFMTYFVVWRVKSSRNTRNNSQQQEYGHLLCWEHGALVPKQNGLLCCVLSKMLDEVQYNPILIVLADFGPILKIDIEESPHFHWSVNCSAHPVESVSKTV